MLSCRMSVKKFAEADIEQVLNNPIHRHAINQAIVNRLAEKVDTSRRLLDSRVQAYQGGVRSSRPLTETLMNGLLLDHFETRRLIMTQKVYEPEAGFDGAKLTRKDMVNYLCNMGSPVSYELGKWAENPVTSPSESVLEVLFNRLVLLTGNPKRDQASQCGGFSDQMEDVERKLQRVELDYINKTRLESMEEGTRVKEKIEKIRRNLQKEMETELDCRLRLLRDREIKDMRLAEQEKYQQQLRELELLAERKLQQKLKGVRQREAELVEEERERTKHTQTVRTHMERKILEDMHRVDKDRLALHFDRQKENDKVKNIEFKLDQREAQIATKEKFLDITKQLKEETFESQAAAIKHMQETRANMESRNLQLLEELTSKQGLLEAKLSSKEQELQETYREMRKRDLENQDRAKSESSLKHEIAKLRDALHTQIEVAKKKEGTMQLLERRLHTLQEENVQLKQVMNEMKKNWMMMREIDSRPPHAHETYKPII